MIVVTASGCGPDATESTRPVAAELTVSPPSLSLVQRGLAQLDARILDKTGAPIPAAAIGYESRDPSIAAVDVNGLVVAGLRPGSTTIAVSALGLTREIPVNVRHKITAIEFDPIVLSIPQLGNLRLGVRVLDLVRDSVSGVQISLTTSNSAVIRIAPTGVLESVGPIGSATIGVHATYAGVTIESGIGMVVTPVVSSIDLTSTQLSVGQGTSGRIEFTARDLLGQPVGRPVVNFTSLDTTLVRTTPQGIVYSVAGLGTTKVRATSGNAVRNIDAAVVPFTERSWNTVASFEAPEARDIAAAVDGTMVTSTGQVGSWKTLSLAEQTLGVSFAYSLGLDLPRQRSYFVGTAGVSAFDLQSGVRLWESRSGAPHHYAIARESIAGLVMYSAGDSIVAVDAETGTEAWRAAGNSPGANGIATHPTEPKIWASWGGGYLTEVDVLTQAVRRIAVGGTVFAPWVSRDGSAVFAIDIDAESLLRFSVATLQRVSELPLGEECRDLVGSPDGSELYIGCSQSVLVLDGQGTLVKRRLPVSGILGRLSISPDGSTLLVVLTDVGIELLR